MFNNLKVALVGGAGFIGHNLALELKSQGADVSIIDGLSVNNLLALHKKNPAIQNTGMYIKFVEERLRLLEENKIKLFVEDASNYNALKKTLDQIAPDVVVLLAAVAHADRTNKDPMMAFDNSMLPLKNALEASKDTVKHFIYYSSSMVYGNFAEDFVTEETVCDPIELYGGMKFGGEKMVIAYSRVFNFPYTIVRPSALYGERCVSQRVIQVFIESALAGKEINIHGDGSDKTDFTYIDDLVQGVTKIVNNPNAFGHVFNVTYGEGRSLQDLTDILKIYFPELVVNYLPKDRLKPKRGTLVVDKAKQIVGYDPQFPLEKGLEKYVAWYKKFVAEHDITFPHATHA